MDRRTKVVAGTAVAAFVAVPLGMWAAFGHPARSFHGDDVVEAPAEGAPVAGVAAKAEPEAIAAPVERVVDVPDPDLAGYEQLPAKADEGDPHTTAASAPIGTPAARSATISKPSGVGPRCGPVSCAPNEACCNDSCGTCVAPGGTCDHAACKQPELRPSTSCGPSTCAPDEVCCNESCGVCTKPRGFCSTAPCAGPTVAPDVTCGASTCKAGEICCNESCGICAPVGVACSQNLCRG
jgi:hypothetical protein